MTIEELLTQWVTEALFGERDFQKQKFTLVGGQKLYMISVMCNIVIIDETKLIKNINFFRLELKIWQTPKVLTLKLMNIFVNRF